jgi:P-loop containing dynein motor region D4
VVLAMSPVGDTLRTRCRNFPGLVNNTVIDWFEPWSEQALQSVATAFLQVDAHVLILLQRSFCTPFSLKGTSLVRFGAEVTNVAIDRF